MIRLFHGSSVSVPAPVVSRGRSKVDFGQGFYLTPDADFSCRWARERRREPAIINTYRLNPEGLTVHRFKRDREWFSYLFQNRQGYPDALPCDVVMGPIANDTLYDTLGILTSGLLKDEQALQLLLLGPEYQQIVLKTEKSG